jgi:Arc/MetJ-type ribon-helix-helix transcriptional regulator
MQVTVRLDKRERDYIDHLIDKGVFASYGHSLRALLHWYKVNQRTIEQFRAENARLKERLSLVSEGKLDAKKAVA